MPMAQSQNGKPSIVLALSWRAISVWEKLIFVAIAREDELLHPKKSGEGVQPHRLYITKRREAAKSVCRFNMVPIRSFAHHLARGLSTNCTAPGICLA